MYQPSGGDGVSSKELAYISDSLKNEELLTKLCVLGAAECQNGQLKQFLSHMAQERLQASAQLMNTLQQQSGLSH